MLSKNGVLAISESILTSALQKAFGMFRMCLGFFCTSLGWVFFWWLIDIVYQLQPRNPQNGVELLQFCEIWWKKRLFKFGDVYSKVRPLRICLRTTFSIAKNETSSLTRMYAGLFTAQIKYPRDWQLTGVDTAGIGGRTGQSFPLHILNDKILLFSKVFVMLGVDMWCIGCLQSASNLQSVFSKCPHLGTNKGLLLLHISHTHKNSRFRTKFDWGSNSVKKSFAPTGNTGFKKKTLGSSHGFGGNWKQVMTGNKSNYYQVLPDTSATYE